LNKIIYVLFNRLDDPAPSKYPVYTVVCVILVRGTSVGSR